MCTSFLSSQLTDDKSATEKSPWQKLQAVVLRLDVKPVKAFPILSDHCSMKQFLLDFTCDSANLKNLVIVKINHN